MTVVLDPITLENNIKAGIEGISYEKGKDYPAAFAKVIAQEVDSYLSDFVLQYNAHIHTTTATVGATAVPGIIAPPT